MVARGTGDSSGVRESRTDVDGTQGRQSGLARSLNFPATEVGERESSATA
jgi:hypothetical protein